MHASGRVTYFWEKVFGDKVQTQMYFVEFASEFDFVDTDYQ